jgi:hypothetical protein
MTNLLHRKRRIFLQFTINVRKSHRQPQCTLQLVCEDRVFFSVQDASEQFVSCTQLSFVNFALHSDTQTKIYLIKEEGEGVRTVGARFKQLYLGKHSELNPRPCEHFFSQWPILSPPKILTFPRESPCIEYITNFRQLYFFFFLATLNYFKQFAFIRNSPFKRHTNSQ